MTKVAMPDPVAYAHRDILRRGNCVERIYPTAKHGSESVSLITTDQAEAYANARVREALKEAANIAGSAFRRSRAAYCSGGEPYAQGAADCAGFIETDIRVLISKQ